MMSQQNHDLLPEEQETVQDEQRHGAQELYRLLRANTEQSKVTGLKELQKRLPMGMDKESLGALIGAVGSAEVHEALKDIALVKGKKDTYYYDATIMTAQYAQLDALLNDKDIMRTVATVARHDSKVYPRPTPFSKLMGMPFWCTEDELLGVAARMQLDEEYQDIRVVTASNGAKGFFSLQSMSENYARSLLEMIEVDIPENP